MSSDNVCWLMMTNNHVNERSYVLTQANMCYEQ